MDRPASRDAQVHHEEQEATRLLHATDHLAALPALFSTVRTIPSEDINFEELSGSGKAYGNLTDEWTVQRVVVLVGGICKELGGYPEAPSYEI